MIVRDFVGYGSHPPTIPWPNGSRLAINIVINYEEGAELTPANGDSSRERMSESAYHTELGEREPIQESVYEFGTRVGIWRILRVLDEFDLPATVFASAAALPRSMEVVRALVAREADFVAHGDRWVEHRGMSEEEERSVISSARKTIEDLTGSEVSGWFTRPVPSENTRRLLVEEGFRFDSDSLADDVPYYVQIGHKWHLVVPYSLDVNDIRFWKGSLMIGDHWYKYARDTFDTLLDESGTVTRLMSIGLHNRIIGRPGRIGALRRLLDHIRTKGEGAVWFCRRSDLAEYWLASVDPNDWPTSAGV